MDWRNSQYGSTSSSSSSSTAAHRHTKSLGTLNGMMNHDSSTSTSGPSRNAHVSHAGVMIGGVPMSPVKSSRGGSGGGGGTFSPNTPNGGSIPMSPGVSLGFGREGEWSDIQARTFCKWLNTKLEAADLEPMTDLVKDFSNGVKLIELLEIMSDQKLGRYNRKPMMRVQKAENAAKALQFIRDSGVKLTNIGPEDIVDGNLKLILGMIWTLILRFTIAGITEEGLSAKDGLLLWCQRKTQNYKEVNIQNFKSSFADGLALCALINRHRPELLDYDKLNKSDRRGNTELALSVAEKELGIPRLLEVKDFCDVEVPDERSVMTYVAEFFHRFSQEDKMETGARRIQKFAELISSILTWQTDFASRLLSLLTQLSETEATWSRSSSPSNYLEAIGALNEFTEFKKTSKRKWGKEKQELGALYSNIQTKLRTYGLRSWEPEDGKGLQELEWRWMGFLGNEGKRSRAINASIREIKEELRKRFAQKADDLMKRLRQIEQGIGTLSGSLSEQKQTLLKLSQIPPILKQSLQSEIRKIHDQCQEAKIEENDYTVLTFDDLEYELELAERGIKGKISFVENQMVSAKNTNITPAKLEEFEATFKHFDKDDTNTLQLWEMHSALASLGIVYADEELQAIYSDLENGYGAVTYEAWLALLVDITKDDSSSADQIREAFRGVANDKPFVTEIDFQQAHLPREAIRFLIDSMPGYNSTNGSTSNSLNGAIIDGKQCDYDRFLGKIFGHSS